MAACFIATSSASNRYRRRRPAISSTPCSLSRAADALDAVASLAAEPGPCLARHGQITLPPERNPIVDNLVQFRQCMKRYRRVGMMLDVIGHVPCEPLRHHAGVGGPG